MTNTNGQEHDSRQAGMMVGRSLRVPVIHKRQAETGLTGNGVDKAHSY